MDHLVAVEVSDCGAGKRLAERHHAFFPCLFANQREAFDVTEMFQIELEVLPESACSPAVKIVHLYQHPKLAALLDQALDLRDEVFVVFTRELARKRDFQN